MSSDTKTKESPKRLMIALIKEMDSSDYTPTSQSEAPSEIFRNFIDDIVDDDYEQQVGKFHEMVNLARLLKGRSKLKFIMHIFTAHWLTVSSKKIIENKEFFSYMINYISDDINSIGDAKDQYSHQMTLQSNIMRASMYLSYDYESEKELIEYIEEQVDALNEQTVDLMGKIV